MENVMGLKKNRNTRGQVVLEKDSAGGKTVLDIAGVQAPRE